MRKRVLGAAVVAVVAALVSGLVAAPAAGAATAATTSCHGGRVVVPGAARVEWSCLADLTTAGTVASGHTDPADYAGLQAAGTQNPSGVKGIQVDGYFPDDSANNTEHAWNHDAQFVLRLPDHWNGGLVIGGTPGNRKQYSLDPTVSDWVLGQGYAFAASDKGNNGPTFYEDGKRPGDALVEWNDRYTQLTRAAKLAVLARYGNASRRTLMTGLSNGGYLVRWQLENHPELYDAGVDWEGTLWTPRGPNLFTYLPTALREYPAYAATGDPAAHDAMLKAGFAPGSEFLWPFHAQVYWGATQQWYRKEFDPGYTGAESDYDLASRPASVRHAIARVSLTGRIGKPLFTVHGTLDTLLPITTDSDAYARMVRAQGRGHLYRYYRVVDGNHVDSLYDQYPDKLRPLLPCYRTAFTSMTRWLDHDTAPPRSTTVPRPATGDLVNRCSLST